MFHDLVFQFHMSTQGVFSTVEAATVLIRTLFSLQNVLVAAALGDLLTFYFSSFGLPYRFEELKHCKLLLLGLGELFLQEFFSLGEEGKFFEGVNGGRHEDGLCVGSGSRRLFLMH